MPGGWGTKVLSQLDGRVMAVVLPTVGLASRSCSRVGGTVRVN